MPSPLRSRTPKSAASGLPARPGGGKADITIQIQPLELGRALPAQLPDGAGVEPDIGSGVGPRTVAAVRLQGHSVSGGSLTSKASGGIPCSAETFPSINHSRIGSGSFSNSAYDSVPPHPCRSSGRPPDARRAGGVATDGSCGRHGRHRRPLEPGAVFGADGARVGSTRLVGRSRGGRCSSGRFLGAAGASRPRPWAG